MQVGDRVVPVAPGPLDAFRGRRGKKNSLNIIQKMELLLEKPITWRRKECRDAFLYEIYNTPCRGLTFNEFKQNVPSVPYIQRYMKKYPEQFWRCYTLYFGTINVFPPSVAYQLYKRYNATVVLDPCAGWGGRAVGAEELGIQYIGYDTNLNLRDGYQTLQFSEKVNVRFGVDSGNEVFPSNTFDMVFTSPPYYHREKYNGMPYWGTKKQFIDVFFLPMCRNAWSALKPGGTMALNIPIWMYETACPILGEATEIFTMPKQKRPKSQYLEYIYCWIKDV